MIRRRSLLGLGLCNVVCVLQYQNGARRDCDYCNVVVIAKYSLHRKGPANSLNIVDLLWLNLWRLSTTKNDNQTTVRGSGHFCESVEFSDPIGTSGHFLHFCIIELFIYIHCVVSRHTLINRFLHSGQQTVKHNFCRRCTIFKPPPEMRKKFVSEMKERLTSQILNS